MTEQLASLIASLAKSVYLSNKCQRMSQARHRVIPPLDFLELRQVVGWQHTYSWHMHDTYVLGTVSQGVARFTTSSGTHWVPPGTVSILHPQEAHAGPVHHQGAVTQSNCYPSVSLIQSVATEALNRPGQLPLFSASVIADVSLASEVLDAQQALCQTDRSAQTMSRVRDLLATLMDRYATFIPEADYWQSSGRIRQVCTYLRTHYRDALSIRTLAEVAGGISEVHLTRSFRQQVGMPPYAYLMYRRVEEAKRLLQQQWEPTQVAFETGFADQSHLTRQFKRMLGTTPGAYRKLYRLPSAS